MPIATLEHVSVGAPITRCGVSFIPVSIHQLAPAIATGTAEIVAAGPLPGQELVWDDVLVHASMFAVAA